VQCSGECLLSRCKALLLLDLYWTKSCWSLVYAGIQHVLLNESSARVGLVNAMVEGMDVSGMQDLC
jgi:hypothetical protein